jgi:hypothetical protein
MKNACNENELLSFVTLSAATGKVLVNLNEQKKEQTDSEPNPGDGDKEADEEKRRYIEHRLKSIAAWEKKMARK